MTNYSNIISNDNHRKKFIERLEGLMREYMNALDITSINKACESLGIKHQSYFAYISYAKKNGKTYTYPNYENLYIFANAFNVTTDYLMCMSDERETVKQKEIDLTIKDICEKTGLNENVVTQLCFNYGEIQMNNRQKILNYFFETNPKICKYIKRFLKTDNENEKDELRVKMIETLRLDHKDEKGNINIYGLKRVFLNNIYFYVFEKVLNIKYFDEKENKFKQLNTIKLTNEYSLKNGIVANDFELDTQLFDKYYLDNANDYLTDIKKHFQKYDYDRYHTNAPNRDTFEEIEKENKRK